MTDQTFKTVRIEITCGTAKKEMEIAVDQKFSRSLDAFKMDFTESVGNLIANKITEYQQTLAGAGCGHIWVSKTVQEASQ